MMKNAVGGNRIEQINKNIIFVCLFFVMILICSCSKKNSLEAQLEEDSGTLNYLKNIAKTSDENQFNLVKELDLFLNAKEQYFAGNYEDSLLGLLKVIYYYQPSTYETEALYLLGKLIPYMLSANPSYIVECYNHLNEQFAMLEMLDDDFTLENFYSFVGIEERSNGALRYNNVPLVRILEEDSSALIPKDDLYYQIRKGDFQTVRGSDDKNRFMLNINRLSFFSELYRTSDKQAILINDNNYFPKELPFTLDAEQRSRYDSLVSRIKERVAAITPEISEQAYVVGDRVRIRDRIRTSSMDDTITLHYLNDYDSVEVLRKIEVKLRGRSDPESWVLVRYNSVYGDIVGFALARYFRNIDGSSYNTQVTSSDEKGDDDNAQGETLALNTDDYKIDLEVYSSFTNALANYRNHRYIEAADSFAFVLAQDNTNYFTDKSSYLLWNVNNSIASLIASQDIP